MLGAALIGLGYLALRSNPKKAKRRGGRPRGWKAAPRVVRRPPGRWKPTGRRAKWRDLAGKFHTQYSTSWAQRQRNERHGMRIVDEVLRDESGRQKLRPGRGRNRRNPGGKLFDIICNGVYFAVVPTGRRLPTAWWIVRKEIENKEAAQRLIDSGRVSQEMLALVNPRRKFADYEYRRRGFVVRVMQRYDGNRPWCYWIGRGKGEDVQILFDAGTNGATSFRTKREAKADAFREVDRRAAETNPRPRHRKK